MITDSTVTLSIQWYSRFNPSRDDHGLEMSKNSQRLAVVFQSLQG